MTQKNYSDCITKKIKSNSIKQMIQSLQFNILSWKIILVFVCAYQMVYAIAMEASVATPHWLFLLRDIMM